LLKEARVSHATTDLLTGRFQSEAATAAKFNIPLATFRHLVDTGKLPGPIAEIGLYDTKAIDAALDRMSGLGSAVNAYDNWREKKRGSR
jgi:hypothetical protein